MVCYYIGMSLTNEVEKMAKHPSKEQLVEVVVCLVQEDVYVPMFIEKLERKHDVLVKDSIPYFPVFTDESQVPEKYKRKFFLAKKPFLEVLDHLDTDRIAVNPFTQNLILEEELLKVVLSCRK